MQFWSILSRVFFHGKRTHLVSVRVGPGEGLVPPVDGVDVAVNAVVVGARPGAGWASVLQTLRVRLGQRLEPGEKNLKISIIK